jgi:hypothetical protein
MDYIRIQSIRIVDVEHLVNLQKQKNQKISCLVQGRIIFTVNSEQSFDNTILQYIKHTINLF